jgi:hypothetical protein
VRKLHEADRPIAEGKSPVVVLKTLQVAEQIYYRWRKAYGTLILELGGLARTE